MKGIERQACEERGKVTMCKDLKGREKGGWVVRLGAGTESPSGPGLPTGFSGRALFSFPLAPAENIILTYVLVTIKEIDVHRCVYVCICTLIEAPTCLFIIWTKLASLPKPDSAE